MMNGTASVDQCYVKHQNTAKLSQY